MKVLIIRGIRDEINLKNYNSQEIGLAKALVSKGNKCDILYFSKNERNEKIIFENNEINIFYRRGIKIFNNAIYYKEICNSILSKYDLIQSNEYNQLMTLICSLLYKNKVISYHGPYEDGKKIKRKIIDRLYDFLFKNFLNKNLKLIFTKSILAQQYLENKGFKNIYTIGVGLDIEKLKKIDIVEIKKTKKILYIGQIIERKNIIFLLKLMKDLTLKGYELTIIGKGDQCYLKKCLEYVEKNNLKTAVNFIETIPQNKIKEYYINNDIFLLPSKEEIFGMVLLEAMYFGMTVISSFNGGSSTIIDQNKNGYLIQEIDEKQWIQKIEEYETLNQSEKIRLKKNAQKTISENFLWNNIASKYLKLLKGESINGR